MTLNQTSIFIVEDDLFFTSLYTAEIALDAQFNLRGSSETGTEALDFLKSNPIDLLICDLHLPDMNGAKVISQAKLMQPDLAILVITGIGQEDDFFECLNFDVKGFIQKDELPKNFSNILSSVKQGYATLSPKIAKKLLNKNANNQTQAQDTQNPLTSRETEVLTMLAKGLPIKSVATELNLSPHTVSGYTKIIYSKLQVRSNVQAVMKGQKNRWIP
ncbi:response regulator transcription factor [Polynucleobacter sp. JS-Fieb-80-E5]|uniref:response regulator transcription factor n=1 Tax=Polynucleobacter sp. JS-Fieb-80-E5 TaxID=2081050 RepID=UPI001C0B077D|nr:response regulator transcription factor [Polynucleobacter sp. JS-Fieb-80-E5]MBU3617848.1 response regulator transcription factor [Polynucleobacter sp. JS-Fieb-80-E5]